jgi:hypothetical protein
LSEEATVPKPRRRTMTTHSEETRIQALAFYSAHGLNETCRRMKGIVGRATIVRWAKEAKLEPPTKAAKLSPAMARYKTFTKARRLQLNDRLFIRIESILSRKGADISGRELQSLATTYAILTDKRRLEEGKGGDVPTMDAQNMERILADAKGKVVRMLPRAK